MSKKLHNIEETIIPNILQKIDKLELEHRIMKKGSNVKKCFVFDFDCTITFNHWYYFTNNFDTWVKMTKINMDPTNDINKLKIIQRKINDIQSSLEKYEQNPNLIDDFIYSIGLSDEDMQIIKKYFIGSIERENALKMFFQILQSNKYDLYILSNGIYVYVQLLLRLLGLKQFFKDENIKGRFQCSFNGRNILCGELIAKSTRFVELFKTYDIVRYVDDDLVDHKDLLLKHIKDINIDYKYYGSMPNSNFSFNINLIKNGNGLNMDLINIILNDNSLNMQSNMSGGYYKYKKYKNKYLLAKHAKY